MNKALIAFAALIVLSMLSIATIGCGQATPKSKMTAIQVIEYANKRLASRDEYEYYAGGEARARFSYESLNAKYLTEGMTIKHDYLKAGTWVLEVKKRGEVQHLRNGTWVVTYADDTTTIHLYKFDENTATLEEIK